jgi:hypothetical protein
VIQSELDTAGIFESRQRADLDRISQPGRDLDVWGRRNLTPEQLEVILGDYVERLAGEAEILHDTRRLAGLDF